MHELFGELVDLKDECYRSGVWKEELQKVEKDFEERCEDGYYDYYNIGAVHDTRKHFKTKAEAEMYLNSRHEDNCDLSYMCTYEYKRSSTYISLKSRLKIQKKKLKDYEHAHSCKQFKAKLIGCPNCGSKINKDFIKNEECPICETNLQSPTTRKTIEGYKATIRELEKQIKVEEKTMQAKRCHDTVPGTLILLSIDTHC